MEKVNYNPRHESCDTCCLVGMLKPIQNMIRLQIQKE